LQKSLHLQEACEKSGSICPYRWFRYALLVPTVARVHFLNLKALVCILISTGSTWDIGTKCRYVLPQGFVELGLNLSHVVLARLRFSQELPL
jgi:hypothetical protein